MEQTPLSKQANCTPAEEQKCPELVTPLADGSDSETPLAKHMTPAEQLNTLRQALEAGQRDMLRFEPLKVSIADIVLRIQSLETAIAAQPAESADYTKFYRAAEKYRSEVECSISATRGQLELSDKQVACIRKAIDTVDVRVKKARSDRDAQDADVKARQLKQQQLEATLVSAKTWYELFTSGMQAQITRQQEDLKALSLLADPSKDQCEVWFYLKKMEAMVQSARTEEDSTGCYNEDINIATFLDCWLPKCYTDAYQHWIVAFNDAESAQKIGAIELTEAIRHAAALATLADEATADRRAWILKEIKAQDCCGPTSKCL